MKDIVKYINEANHSFTELTKDYDAIEYVYTKAEKKAIADKYSCTSMKKADIQEAILFAIRDERCSRKSFTDEDVKWYHRLGMYDLYKKQAELMSKESTEFIIYLKDHYWQYLKTKGIVDKNDTPTWRAFSGSYADKAAYKRYENVVQYLKDTDPTEMKKKDETQLIKQGLIEKFKVELVDFKKEFLDRVKENAGRYYDECPKNMEAAKKHEEKFKKELDELNNANGGYISFRSPEYRKYKEIDENRSFWSKRYYEYYRILKDYKTKKDFVDANLKSAEEKFERNIETLSERVMDRELSIPDIKVSGVHEDPKIFQMMITDGKKKLFARSIIAAEYSEKVSTHFRFIITNRQ